jgi:predicted DNA-binding transcriptional regulator YafY
MPTVDRDVLHALGAVVHAREVLRFGYVDADTGLEGDTRRVEPHHLVTHGQRWYLVAWDLLREEWRIFRADRIRPRVPTGPRFPERQLPGGVDVTTFVVGEFRGASTGLEWPCRAEAIISLPIADVRPYVADGAAEPVGPDRTRVTLGSWSWAGLAADLCRFEAEVEVVDRPELVEAFAVLADRCHRTAAVAPVGRVGLEPTTQGL